MIEERGLVRVLEVFDRIEVLERALREDRVVGRPAHARTIAIVSKSRGKGSDMGCTHCGLSTKASSPTDKLHPSAISFPVSRSLTERPIA